MICNTYLLIAVCLALTAASPVTDDTRALSEAEGKEITPSRPPEDLIFEDDAGKSPDAEAPPGRTHRSFLKKVRERERKKERERGEEGKNYSLPIVEENSVRFFDVSAEEDLSLEANGQNVTGIRASGPECRLVNLEVLAGYILHEELRAKCKKLRHLTLAGNNWRCVGPLHLFVEAMEGMISYANAECGDIKCPTDQEHKNCSLELGMNLTKTYGLKENECPPVCVCSKSLYNHLFGYTVKCVGANITDETIPPFPKATTSLDLSQNQLRSTKPLFKKLGELHNLLIVYLEHNQLESVPYFENNSFAKLEQMFLQDNNIKWLESAAIESILKTQNKDLRIELLGNPLECGKDIYEINVLQISHYKLISDWKNIKCTDGEKENFVKFYFKEESQEMFFAEVDPYIVADCLLGAINLFLMYVIYDLWMAKREMRRTMAGRRPLLDKIICGVTVASQTLFSLSFWSSEKESRGSSDAFYKGQDQVAIRKRTPNAARANASEKNEL
ncbi:uncharacterized protein LOC125034580 [Penaeus chinensis]|uniref:uncharacterized protein LOC125034580 n=1 Tax=Penaeus chinensis TaxID=139456 RepID=UPI001FB7CDBF|nr:uncharacterized protein LOC125034580 [Penaeus chinensis]